MRLTANVGLGTLFKMKKVLKRLIFICFFLSLGVASAAMIDALLLSPEETVLQPLRYILMPREARMEDALETVDNAPAPEPLVNLDIMTDLMQVLPYVPITDNSEQTSQFELPVIGATGWAAAAVPMREESRSDSQIILDLPAGQGFTIVQEQGNWWQVQLSDGMLGWIEHVGCFINLPDVIPSIIYDITNAYSSLKRSIGLEIPNITGRALYEAWAFNPRLDKSEFIVPIYYSTGKKLFEVQQAALADGNTIIVYEAYRPRQTQSSVSGNLRDLAASNADVNNAINSPPWNISWFIATSISHHQRAAAIDASLARVFSHEVKVVGDFEYTGIVGFEEYPMPTAMHELSPRAAIVRSPMSLGSPDAWRNAALADTVTDGAILLQRYFIDAGFSPLASEWWHFSDTAGNRTASARGINGDFFTETVYSAIPRY